MQKPTMAIQLYTLRDFIQTAEDFDKTLSRLSGMGVHDVQISAIGDIPAGIQRDILQKHDMHVGVTHKNFDWLLSAPQEAIEHHRTIGCDAIGIGAAPDRARKNVQAVRAFIEEGLSIQKTADKLATHRNTIQRRLERFQELTQLSLESGRTICQIYLSLTFMEFKRRKNIEHFPIDDDNDNP